MNTPDNWKEEFDERLFEENGWFKELGNGDEDWSSVKAFIESLLLSQKQELAEKIEKMKKSRCRCMCEKSNEAYRYNLVIDEVLALLTPLEK